MPLYSGDSLILASGSAARRTLLTQAGVAVQACPVDLDEEELRRECIAQKRSAGQMALLLAEAKAEKAAAQIKTRQPIVAADQILEMEGTIFSKPRSRDEARRHLLALRGRTHTLHTAAVLWQGGERTWSCLVSPRLTMRSFSDAFLDRYLDEEGARLLDCVGAYRVEGPGVQLFSEIEGSQDAILGLPLLPLLSVLRREGHLRS